MPAKRPSGAPKGNLNASRNGLYSWKRARMLPAHLGHIGRLVEREEAGILQDLGGHENATTQQRSLISDTGMALGLILLAFEEARQRGSIASEDNGKWDFMPGLQKVKGLLDTRRQNLLALGLERRAKDVDKEIIIRKFAEPPPQPKQEQGSE